MKSLSAQQAMQRACGPRAWAAVQLLRASQASQNEIAERLGIGQPSVSTLLVDLERLGLVRRVGRHQGRRGRPKERWEAVQDSADALLDLGERFVDHAKP
jgi:predicted ArsR family transcriptional regulator